MSEDDADDERPKGFDISKLNVEMSDEERSAADVRLKEQFKELAEGTTVMADAMRGIGGLSSVEEAKRFANNLQDAINASGLGSIQDQFDTITDRGVLSGMFAARERMRDLLPDIQAHTSALAGLPDYAAHTSAIQSALEAVTALPEPWGDVYGLTATSRLAEEMRRQHALYLEPIGTFADIRSGAIADTHQSIQAMVLPRLDIKESLGIERMADAFGAANVYQSLGLVSDYDAQMRAITSSLSGHMEALTAAQAVRDAMFPSGLTDAIESLLARSIAAQEAMLAEYRESASDAKTEARFNRRMVTLTTIINILMFFMTVALNIEDRLVDDDAAVRENAEAVRQMRQSFDEMAAQVQRTNEMQEAATEQDRAADAAVADLLREIANRLSDEAESGKHDVPKPPLVD
ncbi:hypothetical protein [Pontivivens ytuae]|uniref:Toxic anion resistance protein (TelA) n=1 Tax=Pontivivens ytuae TaxID=2789856 RepID=A0A7S9QD89_9RHOB|nr:hypothetical protein [Pontivivens ytuae]QPH54743.1 hypothetical protein I0K15_02895 [Pontivivens ytuae]